ncbi:MAG TPA: transcriptional regulator [Terriglobales bacterium]|nr:transcriptional regulator [Terriglobales bacterium]
MSLLRSAILLVAALLLPAWLGAAEWTAIGPDGGDVRSLAYDPHHPGHIYLGTSAGGIYISRDNGVSWSRFARLGEGDHYVIDHILFDPTAAGVLYAGAWSVEEASGDVFRSHDAGKSWQPLKAMHGKSIRALALAPSDPTTLVAGALDGVYRSRDAGDTWQRISPPNHREIQNIESVAIDPKNPDVIYAGTWHLPWKTRDGGLTWASIKQGMIDDSDLFSIIVDSQNPSLVYASACSGIYKSENAGELFHKVQGIPFSARRTRVLKQDPTAPQVVYAGTTEGLWKTSDAGMSWKHMTAANLIVNDVLVDPRQPSHVLLATDRSGVLRSEDGGRSFVASSRGFTHRQVAAVRVDRNASGTLYVGLLNDKEFGGVFVSHDWGSNWSQMSDGLGGRDVFALEQSPGGLLVAGTNRGVFVWESGRWSPRNRVLREVAAPAGKRSSRKPSAKNPVSSELTARVQQLSLSGGKWFAATSEGLYFSSDEGKSWTGGPILGEADFVAVEAQLPLVLAATRKRLLLSQDGGANWYPAALPSFVTKIHGVTLDPGSTLWLATREGAFRSSDNGERWRHVLSGLPATNVVSILYDAEGKRLLANAASSHSLFESSDGGKSWLRSADVGASLRAFHSGHGRVFASTPFDGVLAQPVTPSLPQGADSSAAGGGSPR